MKMMIALLAGFLPAMAFATGEHTVFQCQSATNSGKTVRISGCISGDSSMDGNYEVIACDGEDFEFITIERSTSVAKMTPDMVETVKIPGRLFNLQWIEDGFHLKLNDALAGKLELDVVAEADEQLFTLDLPSMKHSFKAVDCTFDSN